MEFNTLEQLTVEFNPQLYKSSVLVFKFNPNIWPVDKVRDMFNQLKKNISKCNMYSSRN